MKVGSNYSNVYDSQGDQFTADGKYGLSAGAFLSLPLGKVVGIQPEVIYSEKGFKATGAFLGSNYSATPRYKNAWYQATIGFRLF